MLNLGLNIGGVVVAELGEKTPLSEEVYKNYNLENERIQIADYQTDLMMKKLK